MSHSIAELRKQRFDETYKILLTALTLLVSTVIGFYGRASPQWAAFLLGLYGFSLGLWSFAHLSGGRNEYLIKFISWFELLGGISQSILMLYFGNLDLGGWYYAANWALALVLYYFVFRYVRTLLLKEDQKVLLHSLLVYIVVAAVLCALKFLRIT